MLKDKFVATNGKAINNKSNKNINRERNDFDQMHHVFVVASKIRRGECARRRVYGLLSPFLSSGKVCRTDACASRDDPRDFRVAPQSTVMRRGPRARATETRRYITPLRTLSRRRVITRSSRCRGGTSTRRDSANATLLLSIAFCFAAGYYRDRVFEC